MKVWEITQRGFGTGWQVAARTYELALLEAHAFFHIDDTHDVVLVEG